ncbi:MAG TPA: cache domain-containing protein [Syntrophales bacterium]|nr:cache domain-containing protein [Syntrophales bacterium]
MQKEKGKYLLLKPLLAIALLAGLSIGAFFIVYQHWMNSLFDLVEVQHRQNLIQIVSIARNAVEPVLSQVRAGTMQPAEALKRIRTLVRTMTYEDQYGNNYVFMSSYDGIMLVQPFEPAKELTNQWDLRDVRGLYIIRELVGAAMARPSGSFVKYYYHLPGVHEEQEKLAYVVGVPELQCYIGTGMYMQRAIREQQENLQNVQYGSILLFIAILIPISASMIAVLNRNRLLSEEIANRMQIENELKESEEKYRSIFENAVEGIFQITADGRFISVNPAFARIAGYGSPGEMVDGISSINNNLLANPGDGERYREILDDKGFVEDFEIAMKRNDGSIVWVSINSRVVKDEKGRLLYYEGTIEDISERKRAEEDRRKLERQLFQSQKMDAIGQLAGGVAHDFNNILMGIQGNVSLLQMEHDPSHPHAKRLGRIEEHVKRGANLTRQLLGFAREGKYEVRTLAVNDLVRKSVQFFIETRKEIEADLELEADVHPVEADPGQLEQVLLNLYINAGHAMPRGGNLHIRTSNVVLREEDARAFETKAGSYVRISVSDTGVGMDRETLKRIFEPFFTTRSQEGGTGLGLASAYGIIRNHGGLIKAYSEPGRGSTFNVYLPSSEERVPAEDQGPSEDLLTGSGGILLVDDEPMILESASRMLGALGYTVYPAASGQDAVSMYMEKRDRIDLVILDMILPGISGAQVLRMLREIDPGVRVVLSSGYGLQGEVQKVMESGCRGFIQKPYSMKELSGFLHRVLSSPSEGGEC